MPKEHITSCFTFTEREQLYDRISYTRFMALIAQPDVDIHEVGESTNSIGEYLFVTVSCRIAHPKQLYTFWGLGYHEQRERWIADTWQWYESEQNAEKFPMLSKTEALAQISEREAFVRANATPSQPQSRRAQLYELIADLTDEDGALSELEDFGWMFLNDDDI